MAAAGAGAWRRLCPGRPAPGHGQWQRHDVPPAAGKAVGDWWVRDRWPRSSDREPSNNAAGEVLTARQAPHRPGIAPAPGLRAGVMATSLERRLPLPPTP